MISITRKRIIKDNNYILALCVHLIFMILGIIITFATPIYTKRIDMNAIIGTIFLFAVFGIPFGYFMGYKRVRVYLDKIRKLQRGSFQIKTDLLVKKELLMNSSDESFLLEFRDWSTETNKVFKATQRKFHSVEENKEYYLLFIDGYVIPDGIYAVEKYELLLD